MTYPSVCMKHTKDNAPKFQILLLICSLPLAKLGKIGNSRIPLAHLSHLSVVSIHLWTVFMKLHTHTKFNETVCHHAQERLLLLT